MYSFVFLLLSVSSLPDGKFDWNLVKSHRLYHEWRNGLLEYVEKLEKAYSSTNWDNLLYQNYSPIEEYKLTLTSSWRNEPKKIIAAFKSHMKRMIVSCKKNASENGQKPIYPNLNVTWIHEFENQSEIAHGFGVDIDAVDLLFKMMIPNILKWTRTDWKLMGRMFKYCMKKDLFVEGKLPRVLFKLMTMGTNILLQATDLYDIDPAMTLNLNKMLIYRDDELKNTGLEYVKFGLENDECARPLNMDNASAYVDVQVRTILNQMYGINNIHTMYKGYNSFINDVFYYDDIHFKFLPTSTWTFDSIQYFFKSTSKIFQKASSQVHQEEELEYDHQTENYELNHVCNPGHRHYVDVPNVSYICPFSEMMYWFYENKKEDHFDKFIKFIHGTSHLNEDQKLTLNICQSGKPFLSLQYSFVIPIYSRMIQKDVYKLPESSTCSNCLTIYCTPEMNQLSHQDYRLHIYRQMEIMVENCDQFGRL